VILVKLADRLPQHAHLSRRRLATVVKSACDIDLSGNRLETYATPIAIALSIAPPLQSTRQPFE